MPKSKKTPPLYNKEDVRIRRGKVEIQLHSEVTYSTNSYYTPIICHVPVTVLSSEEVQERKMKERRRERRGTGGGRGGGGRPAWYVAVIV